MTKELSWYETDTKDKVDNHKIGSGASILPFKGFYYSTSVSDTGHLCREVVASYAALLYKKNVQLETKVYLAITAPTKEGLILGVSNMRYQVHRLEEQLGLKPHTIRCLAAMSAVGGFATRWVVEAAHAWRYSRPMYSMYLGELRRYYRTIRRGRRLPRSLLHRLVEKRSLKELFGDSSAEGWKTGWGSHGRAHFERTLKNNPSIRADLGVEAIVGPKSTRWVVKDTVEETPKELPSV